MKKIISLLLALCMCLSVVSCFAEAADSDLAYVQAKGKLVVGITDFAPMDFKDENGEWTGYDAMMASVFALGLGVDVEFVEIDWDNKILELNAKTIDCVWNGMTLTEEVAAAMSCTDTYMDNSQVIVMPAAKLAEMTEEGLAALTFAVEAGSAGEEVGTECGFNLTPVTSQAAALMEVAAGTSDAAIIDLLMAAAMTGEGTGYADLDYDFALNEEKYVVGFRTGSDLTVLCNEFFAACAEEGLDKEFAVLFGLAAE